MTLSCLPVSFILPLLPNFEGQGDIKEPTLLLEKSRGSFPGCVVYHYHCCNFTLVKLINRLIAATNGASVC